MIMMNDRATREKFRATRSSMKSQPNRADLTLQLGDPFDLHGLGFMPTMVPGVVEQAYSLYRLFLQDWESGVILPALGNWEGETYCAGSPEDAPRLAAAAARLLHVPPPELEGSFVPPGARASPRGDFYAVEWGDLLLVVLTSLSYTPTCHALGVRDSSNMQACMERDMAEAEKQKEMDGDGGQELGTVISEKKGAAHEAPKMFNEELIALEDKPSSGERRESSDQLRPGEVGEELSEEVGGEVGGRIERRGGGEVGEELSEEVGEEVGGRIEWKRWEEAMDLKARQVGGDEGWERGQEESEEVGWVDGLSDCSFEAEANDTDFTLGAAQQHFLEAALKHSNATFKIIAAHHPLGGLASDVLNTLYGRGGAKAAKVGQQADLHATMVKYGAQVFLHGHDHVFNDEVVDGVHYTCAGSTGAPWAFIQEGGYSKDRMGAHVQFGHLRINVSPTQLSVEMVDGKTGVAKDGYIVEKPCQDCRTSVDDTSHELK
ncbi:hypothetical protein CYMTET_36393 [Cymbomonas tetramitiformis]|uniref:Calcineurin-like phosphoesterase domain-containing protein n=1 Tax=Cymbomonas tetramitiformis TaxID=36881 RepID=A0AAE0F7K2_9CHLO|nr:hypothetical protein CYMTET_36393 [Cymbomonas tetramitiformis]